MKPARLLRNCDARKCELTDLDEILYEFTNSFQPVRRAWLQAAAHVLGDSGVSLPTATAILHVSRMGNGLQQSELAESVGVNPATMLRTLDQAEKAGFLERRNVPENRRVTAIYILPAGERLAAQMEEALADLRRTLLGDLRSEEIAAATRTIRQFESRIGKLLSKK